MWTASLPPLRARVSQNLQQPVEAGAEKERAGPADDDDQHVGWKRIGELTGHQHLHFGEFLRVIPRGGQQLPLRLGRGLEAVEIAAEPMQRRPGFLEGERLWPPLSVAEEAGARTPERRLQAGASGCSLGPIVFEREIELDHHW